ncbi:VOC family protein [Guggenheimella bovis]
MRPHIKLDGITIDCPEEQVEEMLHSYEKLTGYMAEPIEEGVMPGVFGPHLSINIQGVKDYQGPTWPTQERGQMLHMDFFVRDLDSTVEYAKSIGAREAEHQYGETWRVFLDPAGHPFCLTLNGRDDGEEE